MNPYFENNTGLGLECYATPWLIKLTFIKKLLRDKQCLRVGIFDVSAETKGFGYDYCDISHRLGGERNLLYKEVVTFSIITRFKHLMVVDEMRTT